MCVQTTSGISPTKFALSKVLSKLLPFSSKPARIGSIYYSLKVNVMYKEIQLYVIQPQKISFFGILAPE
jgi:hypothetical protein